MRLVPLKQLVEPAHRDRYAVPHFNVCNLETVRTVLSVANERRSPVILGAHWLEYEYAGARTLVNMIENVGAAYDLDVAVHLDHGRGYEDAARVLAGGFTSVMFDGSSLPLEENVAITEQVVALAAATGASVEGEVGTIGQTTEFGDHIPNAHLADPRAAERLANTGIDVLAVAIGNAHGFYTAEPKLEFGLLEEIAGLVSIPLVLHGGTGIPEDQIRRAITMGISKINFSAMLRKAFITAMHTHLEANPNELGLMDILAAGSAAMRKPIEECIDLCMSAGRARGGCDG
jgi:ketose-bisphosphate aldolase